MSSVGRGSAIYAADEEESRSKWGVVENRRNGLGGWDGGACPSDLLFAAGEFAGFISAASSDEEALITSRVDVAFSSALFSSEGGRSVDILPDLKLSSQWVLGVRAASLRIFTTSDDVRSHPT